MTFWSALILGLLASGHCAGMCGGLQIAILSGGNREQVIRSKADAHWHVLLLNVGRIATYVGLGVGLTLLSYNIVMQLDIDRISGFLRNTMALIIILIGVQIMFSKRRPFQSLERIGSFVWKPASRLISHHNSRKASSFISGIAWGFLPCGLVYSVLLVSVASADVMSSATVLFGFGLGTLPALVLTGLLYRRFQTVVTSRYVHLVGGLFFIAGGIAMLSAPLWVSREFMHDYPVLLNTLFCVT